MRSVMALAAGMMALACVTPAYAACTGSTFATINLLSEGRNGLTKATVNDNPVEFYVSSGVFFSIMPKDMAVATGVEIKPISTSFGFYFGKNSVNAGLGYAGLLKFEQGSIASARFIVVSGESAPRYATIGQNILGMQDAEFDLRENVIRLRKRPMGCTGKDMAYWAAPEAVRSLSLETPQGQLDLHNIGKVLVNGVPLRTRFSSSDRTIITTKAQRKLGSQILDQDGRDVIKVNTLDIGGEVQRDVAIEVGGDLQDIDMVIGTDFFMAHRIYMSNGRRTMFFTANPPAPVATADAN